MSPKEGLVLTPPGAPRARPPVHRCVVPGCRVALPRHLLMCSPHWARVPGALRGRLVAMYRHGQVGTPAHQAVVREALDVIAAAEPPSEAQPTLPGVERKLRLENGNGRSSQTESPRITGVWRNLRARPTSPAATPDQQTER